MISVDSFGWIERFTNGPKAHAYNRIIDRTSPAEMVTSVVTFYEVYKKVKRAKGEETALEAVAALSQTNVVPLDQTISLEAADYGLEHNLRFADAIVYATARRYSADLHTSGEDLRGLKGVAFI